MTGKEGLHAAHASGKSEIEIETLECLRLASLLVSVVSATPGSDLAHDVSRGEGLHLMYDEKGGRGRRSADSGGLIAGILGGRFATATLLARTLYWQARPGQ